MDIGATYDYKILEGFLFIEDRGEVGRLSVTNDMEDVLKKIKDEVGDEIHKLKVIYKDSEGIWDGVRFKRADDENLVLTDFVILNEKDLEKAVMVYLEKFPEEEDESKFLFEI